MNRVKSCVGRRFDIRLARTALSMLIIAIQTIAVVCQFMQRTDPRFPLLYFTVDSAILAGAVSALSVAGFKSEWLSRLRLTAAVGVLISAIVFATLIAPASETGTWFQPHDDVAVRVATALMHGVAPIMVTVDAVLRVDTQSIRSTLSWSYLWPLVYMAGLALLAGVVGPDVIPYPFLRPRVVGWPTAVVCLVVLLGLVAALGFSLGLINRAVGRRLGSNATSPTGGREFDDPCRRGRLELASMNHRENTEARRMSADLHDEVDDPSYSVDLLPDLQRASSPWSQMLRDITAPAPISNWASDVTTTRIKRYDRIRPFVTRGVLLAALAILLSLAPGASWLTWVLLIPAAIQVVFEIILDFQLYAQQPARVRALERLTDIAESAHSTTLVNFTGVVGAIAVPCNIVAVSYLSGPGSPSWVKVVALGVAAAYGVSAIMSFLTDATHYSAHQVRSKPYLVFQAVRPHVWLIILVLMTGIVAGSIALQRWAPAMVPLAWTLCVFPVVIGMKQRDYERFLRASSEQLSKVQREAKQELGKDYHNANTDIRTFNRQLAADKSVPAAIRVRAAALAPLISLMGEAIDHERWVEQQQRPSLEGFARKYGSDASLNLVVDLKLDDLQPRNYELARALISALLVNVGQAMNKYRSEHGESLRDDRVWVTGQVSDGQVHLAVRDPLPLITDWCREGSTTLWLHEDLIAHGGKGLSQHQVDEHDPDSGKEIRASWPVKKPPLKLRERRR
ncbi:Pr6Pr family membrane protein [Mycolicibacterium sp. jd]|uniref:Pr6Pr family membrane protein n=1 Tax=unclassified Mycolicibacterium TaxID=2636767 RepID=UPI00351B433E